MRTQVITLAPEALVSPQLAAEVLEIEAKPNSAEATTATTTTGKPENSVDVDALDSHQLAMHVTLNRIIELAPQFFASKEKYAKVRLELGREYRKLQELHAKPGCGTFVERVKALQSKTNISKSTAYTLIAESEIADGVRQQAEKKAAPKPAFSLSKPRKDESNAREQSFTIVANDPTLGLALDNPEPLPALAEAEVDDAKVSVQLRIPSSQLQKWDDALMVLQSRPGYEAANQSELVIEAVTEYAVLVKIHQVQAQEEALEKTQAEAGEPAATESGPGEAVCE
jgi:hypothetical protein